MANAPVIFRTGGAGTGPVYTTDGTPAGTVRLGTLNVQGLGSLGNGLGVFAGDTTSAFGGAPLYVTDGTAAGTTLVGVFGWNATIASYALLSPGRAVFAVYRNLWTTDGTAAGTTLVMTGFADPGYGNALASLGNGKAVFPGADRTFWVTDGTAAGTVSLGVGATGPGTAPSLTSFRPMGNGRILFTGYGSDGYQLYVTDGTAAGTTLLRDLYPGGSAPAQITPVGHGRFVFTAYGDLGRELWVTDGTAAGTVLLKDINPGIAGSEPDPGTFTSLGNGLVVFGADDGTAGVEPWVTDGTLAGTRRVADLAAGSASSLFPLPGGAAGYGFTALGDGRAVFAANDGAGAAIWVTDGTAPGTTLLRRVVSPGGAASSTVYGFTSAGPGKALFSMNDGITGVEPWVTDGTAAGTVLLRDIAPGAPTSQPGSYTTLGSPGVLLVGSQLQQAITLGGGSAMFETAGSTLRTRALSGTTAINQFVPYDSVDLAGITGATLVTGAAGTTVTAAGGTLTFGAAPAGSVYKLYGDGRGGTQVLLDSPAPADAVRFTDAATGSAGQATGEAYSGPVDYLQRQYIWSGTDPVAIIATTPNVFLKGGPAGDALQVTGGNNVLDGGGGSNFLIGATGADGGFDTFFVDGRGGVETWSTIVNFHQGDQATIFGFHPGISTRPYTENDGAVGYTGLTIHSELNGVGTGILASMTFTGVDLATANAHFSITTGTLLPGTAGAIDYLLIQYNR